MSEWFSVKDRLPDRNGDFIIGLPMVFKNKRRYVIQSVMHFNKDNKKWEDFWPGTMGEHPTYWTEIPKPAEDGKPSEWVSVRERLPECSGDRLVSYDSGKGYKLVTIMSFNDRTNVWATFIPKLLGVRPTHWRDFPEPPKEDEA